MWTYSHTSLPTIWCDLTFLLLALLSLAGPLQNSANVMICAHGHCHLPPQSVFSEAHFAFSGPSPISMPTLFSKSHWVVALLTKGVKGDTKSRSKTDPSSPADVPSQERSQVISPSQPEGCSCCWVCLQVWPVARLSAYPRVTLSHTHAHTGPECGWLHRLSHTHRAARVAQPSYSAAQTHSHKCREPHPVPPLQPIRMAVLWWKHVCPQSPHP